MHRGLFWLLAMAPTFSLGASNAPMNWSPDGQWVVYTVTTPTDRSPFRAGWLFDTTGAGRAREVGPAGTPPNAVSNYRLYAADSDTGETVLLHESAGPLTSAAWSPDGRSIAFGRVANSGPSPGRFEVVIQDAPGRERVICQATAGDATGARDWVSFTPAWSPDGNYLAVPDVSNPKGLSVVRVGDGRVLRTVEGAYPAWSPDGTRLAYIQSGRTTSLVVVEVSPARVEKPPSAGEVGLTFGPPRHQVDLGQAQQPPSWTRDGRSLLAVARRMVVRGRGPTLQIDLLKVRVDSGSVETVAHLTADPMDQDKPPLGVCLTTDRDVDNVFSSLDVDAELPTIVWYRPKTQETVDRFHPLANAARVGSLALSPDGKTLAVRFGEPGGGSTAALYDVTTHRLTLLASDEPSRREWISLLIAGARRLLNVSLPPATVGGRRVERPTILPVPGEIPANQQETALRLQKIGRLGRPLCEPAPGPDDVETRPDPFPGEARLFFDMLREDYPAALASLEAMEARSPSPDARRRLLTVRAQIFIGMGDPDRASKTIEFLGSVEDHAVSRFEETPAGPVLTPLAGAKNVWTRYLASRLEEQTEANATRPGADHPADGPNLPEALRPAFRRNPFDRLPNGVFVIPPPDGPFPAPNRPAAPVPRPRILRPRPRPVPPPPVPF